MMKRLLQFLKTTLVGGLLFLVPIIVLVIIVGKAMAIAARIVTPLAAHLPVESVIGLRTPVILASALIVSFCFLAGIIARARFARKLVNRLESGVLSNLPGYEFIKANLGSSVGAPPEQAQQVVLARIEDAWQIAFLVERLDDGHVAVFVPGAPNPQSGSVYFMTQDRIKTVDIPPARVLKCLRRLGGGSNDILHGLLTDGRKDQA